MVAGGARGMDEDRIGEIGDRTSEGQAAGVYGAGFTVGLWGGKAPGVGQGGQRARLVLTRSL